MKDIFKSAFASYASYGSWLSAGHRQRDFTASTLFVAAALLSFAYALSGRGYGFSVPFNIPIGFADTDTAVSLGADEIARILRVGCDGCAVKELSAHCEVGEDKAKAKTNDPDFATILRDIFPKLPNMIDLEIGAVDMPVVRSCGAKRREVVEDPDL